MKKNLLLISLSLLISIISCEIFARIYFELINEIKPHKPLFKENPKDQFDSLMGWTHRPGVKVHQTYDERTVTYKINDKGFRDSLVVAYKKNLERKRIVIIGDSFTFGHGVEETERYGNRLKEKLGNVDMINLGVSGYSTAQQYLTLKNEGFKYQPDLVILGLYMSNINRNLDTVSRPFLSFNGDSLVPVNVPINYKAALTVSDEQPYTYGWLETHLKSVQIIEERLNYLMRRIDPLPQYEDGQVGWLLLKKIIKEMNDRCKKRDCDLVVILIPNQGFYGGTLEYWTSKKPFEQMIRFTKEENIPCINLLPTLSEYTKNHSLNSILIKGDGHWNALGHMLVADYIYQELTNIYPNLISSK